MNSAHDPLLLDHVPIIGSIFGFLLLSVAITMKSDELKKVGLWFCMIIALASIPVYLTSELTEQFVRRNSDLLESIIEQLESSAMVSLIAIECLGLASVVGILLL